MKPFLRRLYKIFRNLKNRFETYLSLSRKDFYIASADFLNRAQPKFFFNTTAHVDSSRIREDAEKISTHHFNLLGSGEIDLGPMINWHRDFKTGFKWNSFQYYRNIKIPYNTADIKVPWELSRFYHAATLGQAYALTRDEKYAKEFVEQINDWIDTNKPGLGVNWSCTMEVAIRACNWIFGFYFLKDSPVLREEFLLKFVNSLYRHGQHIMSNLEYSDSLTSNHYLSNLTGLVYLGIFLPEVKEASRWKEFGISELKKEMDKQGYEDGCDFEASTCYHRLVLELFFFPTLLVAINDADFSGNNYPEVAKKILGENYVTKLYKMFEAVLYLLKPDGTMPQIGDNDSGRLHIFLNRETLDMRYLLTWGAIFFNEPKFKIEEFGFCEEALWIFAEAGYQAWQNLPGKKLSDIKSRSFNDAGWYVMRSDKDYLLVTCGPNGQNGNGGHAHNDKLGFELCLNGQNIIIDPGTYVYTPDTAGRNQFRSTFSHNTVVVDGHEQNRINPHKNYLFTLTNDCKTQLNHWETTALCDSFEGQHEGYLKRAGVIHKRRIKLFKEDFPRVEITDIFLGEGEHDLEWHLILYPNARGRINIISPDLVWKEDEAFYSPGYGEKLATIKLTAQKKVKLPWEVSFLIKEGAAL